MSKVDPNTIRVDLEFTPNPNTLKYVTDITLVLAGAHNFPKKDEAVGKSKLAESLFAIDGVDGIMVGKTFVTVTLGDSDRLTELNDRIIDTMKGYLASGQPALEPAYLASKVSESSLEGKSDIEQKIIKILDAEIRPAVAMDGGDISFEKFEDGIVFLSMKGSCSGCPSSTATLKMGIENRLKDAIPEIIEVVAI